MNMRSALILAGFLASLVGFGQIFTNVTPGAAYEVGGNWNTGTVPGGGQSANMASAFGGPLVIDALYNGGNFTTTGRLLLGHGGTRNGTLTFGPGAGTLTFVGNSFGGANYVGVDGGTGTLTLNGGKFMSTSGWLRVGSNAANSTGTVNVNAGEVEVTTQIHVGNGNASNVGALNISGGAVRMNQLHVVSNANIGPGGTGSLNLSGNGVLETIGGNPRIFIGASNSGGAGNATLSVADNSQITSNHDFIVGFLSPATGTQSGGTITVNAPGSYFVGPFSTGTMTQTGGLVQIDAASPQGLSVGTVGNGTGVYNLNGGAIELAKLTLSTGSATGTLNLGGGTLRMNAPMTDANPISLTGTGGNGTIDTNGHNSTFSGLLTGSGGLRKTGAGTLTLGNANNSFTGDFVIDGGTVPVTSGGPAPTNGQLGAVNASRTVRVEGSGILSLESNDVFGNHVSNSPVRLEIGPGGLVTNLNRYNSFINPTIDGGELRANGGANPNYPAYQLRGTVTVPATGAGSLITATNSINNLTGIHLGYGGGATGTTTFDVATGADLTINNQLHNGPGGASSLVKTGGGTLTLTNTSNNFSGDVTISGGLVPISFGANTPNPGNSPLGALNVARTVRVESGGTLQFLAHDPWGNAATTTPVRLEIGAGGLVTNFNSYSTFFNPTIDGGTLEANGGANPNYPAYQLRGTVAVTGAGSQITVGSAPGSNTLSAISLGRVTETTTFDVAGGADLTIENVLQNGPVGIATLRKTGDGILNLTGANTYTGPTNVDAGTLLINGSHNGTGLITVAPGASLGGSGSASAPVLMHGSLAPGNSPDIIGPFPSFTFAAGSNYDWEILDANGAAGPTGWDRLDVTGAFTIADATDFTINVDGLATGFSINKGYETGPFDIVDYGTFSITSGTLAQIAVDPGPFAGLGYFTLTDTGSLLQLTFTATVPEPGTWALFGVFALVALVGIRRKQAAAAQ